MSSTCINNSYSRMMQGATYQRGDAPSDKNYGYHATLLAGLLSFLTYTRHIYQK